MPNLTAFAPLFTSRIPAVIQRNHDGGAADFIVDGIVQWRIGFTTDSTGELMGMTLQSMDTGHRFEPQTSPIRDPTTWVREC
jgi:hypothetical protein